MPSASMMARNVRPSGAEARPLSARVSVVSPPRRPPDRRRRRTCRPRRRSSACSTRRASRGRRYKPAGEAHGPGRANSSSGSTVRTSPISRATARAVHVLAGKNIMNLAHCRSDLPAPGDRRRPGRCGPRAGRSGPSRRPPAPGRTTPPARAQLTEATRRARRRSTEDGRRGAGRWNASLPFPGTPLCSNAVSRRHVAGEVAAGREPLPRPPRNSTQPYVGVVLGGSQRPQDLVSRP